MGDGACYAIVHRRETLDSQYDVARNIRVYLSYIGRE